MCTTFQGAFTTCYNLEAGFYVAESTEVMIVLKLGQADRHNKAQPLGWVLKWRKHSGGRPSTGREAGMP